MAEFGIHHILGSCSQCSAQVFQIKLLSLEAVWRDLFYFKCPRGYRAYLRDKYGSSLSKQIMTIIIFALTSFCSIAKGRTCFSADQQAHCIPSYIQPASIFHEERNTKILFPKSIWFHLSLRHAWMVINWSWQSQCHYLTFLAEMFNSGISYQYQYQPTQWGSYQYQLLSTQLKQRTININSTWVALINLSTPYQLVFLSCSSTLKNFLDFANFINHE